MSNSAKDIQCWGCGSDLTELSLPIRRLDHCKICGHEIHVCKMCVEFDRSYAHSCKEPIAEEVRDKERANFCDFFKPRKNAYVAPNHDASAAAESALDDLFKK